MTAISGSSTTYTAAQLLGGVIRRSTGGLIRSDTTPTAAQIVDEMQTKISNIQDGSCFTWHLCNPSGAVNVNLNGGSGVTLYGDTSINPGHTFSIVTIATDITDTSEAVEMYIVGSG